MRCAAWAPTPASKSASSLDREPPGAQAPQVRSSAGKNLGARLRGMDEVVYATEDIIRGCELGLRSVLVADEGQLWLVNEMKKAGELPADLVVKISVQMGAANPIAIKLLEDMGAGTYNTPTDLTLPQMAAIRAAIDIPLDVYVEAPDDFGGFVRHYETPELIRVASPVYVKLGLRNAANIYPSGMHIEDLAVKQSQERAHRTALVMNIIERLRWRCGDGRGSARLIWGFRCFSHVLGKL